MLILVFLYYGSALLFCALTLWFLYGSGGKGLFGSRLTGTQLVALVYSAFFFVRTFGGLTKIQETVGLNVYSPFGAQGAALTALSAILLWLLAAVR